MMHRAARRDANEAEVVAALRAAGALVYHLDGRDLPDLLVGFRGRWTVVEVKRPAGPRGGLKGRKLRPGQAALMMLARAQGLPIVVARTAEEALEAIGAVRAGQSSNTQGPQAPERY